MTSMKRALAFEWAVGFLILPVVLILCPLVAVWWWWNTLTESIELERSRLDRNEWLARQVHETQEGRKA